MQDLTPQPSLTPSEVVYLARDRFAPPSGPTTKNRAQQAYAAAFLAAEQAGMLRFGVRPKKALFGLRTVDAFYADPVGSASAFPKDSLESLLHKHAVSLCEKNRHEVWNVVFDLTSLDASDPFDDFLGRIQGLLATRDLLTATQKKTLKIFTVTEYSVPEWTAAAAEEQVSEVQKLLQECQAARPEVWKHLIDGVTLGIGKHKRTEESASDHVSFD